MLTHPARAGFVDAAGCSAWPTPPGPDEAHLASQGDAKEGFQAFSVENCRSGEIATKSPWVIMNDYIEKTMHYAIGGFTL